MSREADELLDRCIAAAREGRDPEAILRERPDLAEGVRPLVALARELEGLPAPAASGQRLNRLLAKVEAEEGTRGTPDAECRMPNAEWKTGESEAGAKAPRSPRRRRWLRAAIWAGAAAAVAVAAGWGLVRTSQGALPGDRLYVVKRAGEGVRYLLAFTLERKAEVRLRLADTRLYEAYREHLDGPGLDLALLGRMAAENRRALALAGRLRGARLGRVLAQAAWSFQYQCDMIGELQRRVGAQEGPILAPYVESCCKLCKGLELGPWGEPAESPVETVGRLRSLADGDPAEP